MTKGLFAKKLDYLIRTHLNSDGSERSYKEMEEGMGSAVTSLHIRRLREGESSNPTYAVIAAIANYFKVDAQFFFEDADPDTHPPERASAQEILREEIGKMQMRSANVDLQQEDVDEVKNFINYVVSKREPKADRE